MNQRKRLLSDVEKLYLLNRLGKIYHQPNQNRTNYHKNTSISPKKNFKTFYLQRTNPSSFPLQIKLVKKERKINSLSPNSFRNLNPNNSYEINELKNSLGNPKYARNIMINSDLRNNKFISVSTIPNLNNSYDNKNRIRNLLSTQKRRIRNKSFNNNIHIIKTESYDNTINDEINDINLDNLTFLEGRLNDIIQVLYSNKNIFDINAKNECFQFLKYYKQCSLFNKFPLYFSSNKNKLIIKSAFNLHLFIIIITYNLSSNQSMINKIINFLKKIYYLLKTNLFLIMHQIQISNSDLINDIHFQTCNFFLKQKGFYDLNENNKITYINNNCISIVNDIKIILNLYQAMNNEYFSDLYNIYLNISKITEQDIYNYFYTSIAINNNYNTINTNSIIIQKEQEEDDKFIDNIIFSYKLNKKIPPFLSYKSTKKFTIVLDLEDTLLNIKLTDTGKLILNLRPGLISFLLGIKPFYEIISFSKFSKSYSTTIINYIQQGKKLFDVNLYREHCALIGKKFIKDISRIGRDIRHILMVDDLPENLYKFNANGILIFPYEGNEQNNNDRVLYELKKMLILFCKLGYDDIRLALKQFKDDIYTKITLGINE